jgi:hypothetical protein
MVRERERERRARERERGGRERETGEWREVPGQGRSHCTTRALTSRKTMDTILSVAVLP